ncbi:MAG: CAP domain-containing protein [Chloroflexi bacterium]|nr:CAP domain-containing protein [Chloroflexota bacterium]
MPAGQPASRRTILAIFLTLTALSMLALWRQSTASAPAHVIAQQPALVSDVLAAHERRGLPNGDIIDHSVRPAAPPPLIEILQAADILARANALPAPPAEPPLIEVLQAADMLAKAGLLPVPAPAEPPLIEILQAADILAKAGLLPAAPEPAEPPLIEILQAAVLLQEAGVLARTEQPAPPPAPVIQPAPTPEPPQPAPVPEPSPVSEPTAPAADAGGWYDDDFSAHVRDLVNERRAEAGLAPVGVEPRLATAAARYAKLLSDNNWFSHTGPDGSTLVDRVESAGFPFDVQVGEVLAWGNQGWGAADIVQAWMDSPSHREQILSPVYTRAGTSCYFTHREGVTVHCVMDFAG